MKTNFQPTEWIVRTWHRQAKTAPLSRTRSFDNLETAEKFYRAEHIFCCRVELEAWSFNPKHRELLKSRS